ncbi:hypothetical protein MMC19_001616 [Ptychographa xylographoides]|nr:hypothetical protein [Ptychographa xylographoides]
MLTAICDPALISNGLPPPPNASGLLLDVCSGLLVMTTAVPSLTTVFVKLAAGAEVVELLCAVPPAMTPDVELGVAVMEGVSEVIEFEDEAEGETVEVLDVLGMLVDKVVADVVGVAGRELVLVEDNTGVGVGIDVVVDDTTATVDVVDVLGWLPLPLFPPALPPALPLITFGHSSCTPLPSKNKPISVVGSASVP